MSTVDRPLFGGAIKATTPADLVDASDFRQVSDTQEVFMYPASGISIIVEILQSVEPVDGIEAVRYHFSALAHDNDAKHTDILRAHKIERDSEPPVFVLHGEQRIQKFNATEHDRVCILMALYRIEEKKADLVVTFNVPTEAADGKGVGEAGLKLAQQDFEKFVTSLCIIDDGLFAEHP